MGDDIEGKGYSCAKSHYYSFYPARTYEVVVRREGSYLVYFWSLA